MGSFSKEEEEKVYNLMFWLVGSGGVLIGVALISWSYLERLSFTGFVGAVLVGMLFFLAAASIWTTIPGFFGSTEGCEDSGEEKV